MKEVRTKMKKYLIWDFDGTLGYRLGGFGEAILAAIQDIFPGYPGTGEQIRGLLKDCFPWLAPEKPHTDITTPDEWWERLFPFFEEACREIGIDPGLCGGIARSARKVYSDLKYWKLFEDSLASLEALGDMGWTQVIFTNHVPEIGSIIRELGLSRYAEKVFVSADIGYEKPHPLAFAKVIESLENKATKWMIGDTYRADILGAEAAGIPGILVRKPNPDAKYFAKDLFAATDFFRDRA
jgi:putative hydrolase of the HAD superfamily